MSSTGIGSILSPRRCPAAVRLRDALTKPGVPNQLPTVPAGGHGNFTPEQGVRIFSTIREFLAKHGLSERK